MWIKEWTEQDRIQVWDLELERNVYLEPWVWVKNPNRMPGFYKKSGSDFRVGKDNGRDWWCIGSPSLGRFEFKVEVHTNKAIITLLPEFSVDVHIWEYKIDHWDMSFLWKGKVFFNLPDLLLELYLENAHDYTYKDMVYAVGKRKYSDTLIPLIPDDRV